MQGKTRQSGKAAKRPHYLSDELCPQPVKGMEGNVGVRTQMCQSHGSRAANAVQLCSQQGRVTWVIQAEGSLVFSVLFLWIRDSETEQLDKSY